MALKPQDIAILLKLITLGYQPWSCSTLAHDLAMSPSEVYSGIKRAARLFDSQWNVPIMRALREFLGYRDSCLCVA